MSSNPVHGEVYSIQKYVIKFISDSAQVLAHKKSILITVNKFNKLVWHNNVTLSQVIINELIFSLYYSNYNNTNSFMNLFSLCTAQIILNTHPFRNSFSLSTTLFVKNTALFLNLSMSFFTNLFSF